MPRVFAGRFASGSRPESRRSNLKGVCCPTPPAQPWIALPCKRLLRFNRGTPLNDTDKVKVVLWQMCESETWAQQLG